jgi:chromosome segregation ATPase
VFRKTSKGLKALLVLQGLQKVRDKVKTGKETDPVDTSTRDMERTLLTVQKLLQDKTAASEAETAREGELRKLHATLSSEQVKADDLRRQLKAAESSVTSHQKEYAEAVKDKRDADEKLKKLRKAQKIHEGELADLNEQLTAARKDGREKDALAAQQKQAQEEVQRLKKDISTLETKTKDRLRVVRRKERNKVAEERQKREKDHQNSIKEALELARVKAEVEIQKALRKKDEEAQKALQKKDDDARKRERDLQSQLDKMASDHRKELQATIKNREKELQEVIKHQREKDERDKMLHHFSTQRV